MKTFLFIFGTRPEAIKMAPLIKAFQNHPTLFKTKVCVTAQHREMLDQVLTLFDIRPDFDCNLMKPNQDLYDITAQCLLTLKPILETVKPDYVVVHGDTTTTLGAALAAFYKHIPIVHIEAGLRSHNLLAPWPEEANRVITGRLAQYHFAPTQKAATALREEGCKGHIEVTGNTVIDALLEITHRIAHSTEEQQTLKTHIRQAGYTHTNKPILLVTGHRRENFGNGFIRICNALAHIAQSNPELDIVYPVHLNPKVQKPVRERLSTIPNIYLIPPLDYLPFVYLMNQSKIILTDSGGIQEEAPSLGKPVLVMRDTTERTEGLESGTVKLVGTDTQKIITEVQHLLDNDTHYKRIAETQNPYGDGCACDKIVTFFIQEANKKEISPL